MTKIVVFGAGRLGCRISDILLASSGLEICLADGSEDALDGYAGTASRLLIDARESALDPVLANGDILIAALPYYACLPLAKAAVRNGAHYLDFSESAQTAREILALGADAKTAVVPSCGFSPGILSALITQFADTLEGSFDLDVYVGVLPDPPTNRLGYGLVMNVDGLLKEYLDKAHVKRDGEWHEVDALTLEQPVTVDGVRYEAFTTGGSTNELPEKVSSRVRNYVYRTLRYPGHLDSIRLLLDDLRLRDRTDMLRNLLMNGLPAVHHDLVAIQLAATRRFGRRGEERRVRSWTIKPAAPTGGSLYEIAARHAAAIVELICEGKLAGPVHQENIGAAMLLSNPHLRDLWN